MVPMDATPTETSVRIRFADAERRLAEALPGYEPRAPQTLLAEAMERTLDEPGRTLIAEAGTGVGKSFASLIPAILSGQRVVMATATKALQDQIRDKDLPFLEETLGVPFTWTVLKGRSNYACVARLDDPETIAQVGGISVIRDLIETHRTDLDWFGEREQFEEMTDAEWRLLTSTTDECPGKSDCPWGGECLVEKARAKANTANVVVVNQALLMIDTWLRATTDGAVAMMTPYDALIIDEAHELEDWATGALTSRFTVAGVLHLMSMVSNVVAKVDGDVASWMAQRIDAVRFAANELFASFEKEGRIYPGDFVAREDEWFTLVSSLVDIETDLGTKLDRFAVGGFDDDREGRKIRRQLKSVCNRVGSMRGRIVDLIVAPGTELVRWVSFEERSNRRTGRTEKITVIESAPVSVASFLAQHLWTEDRSYALVSATISVQGKMEYVAERLGIPRYEELLVGTSFDYPSQAALYVPRHLPEPSGQTRLLWEDAMTTQIEELISAAGGGALVLFTSVKTMRATAERLARTLQDIDFKVQGDEPNPKLLEWFKANPDSCLLATRSFMTGVDVPGDALRLLIVDKLPFPIPTDPMVEARSEAIDALPGKSSFAHYTVPVMTLILAQAFGRLIRTNSDRGLVAILDPRLATKSYGGMILNSLPPARRVSTLDEAREVFA